MTRQEWHQSATPSHGNATSRQEGDAEFDAATGVLCNASDDTFFQRSKHPHPVHACNAGLLSAWKQWPAIHLSVSGQSLAMRTIDTSYTFTENETMFSRLFHRCQMAGYAVPADLDQCLKGMATLAAAARMYWLRPHALIELTPAWATTAGHCPSLHEGVLVLVHGTCAAC